METDHANADDAACAAVPASAAHARPCAGAVAPLLLQSVTNKKIHITIYLL